MMQFAQTTDWLDAASNLLLFGASGTGKTHVSIALGRSIIELGKRVKFLSATTLVQQLQQAKLQLQLPAMLVKLDRYDLLILVGVACRRLRLGLCQKVRGGNLGAV